MTQTATGPSVNLGTFRDMARQHLADALDQVRGHKTLILDPTITRYISRVAEFSFFKEHGVDQVFHLDSGDLDLESRNVMYIIRPSFNTMQTVAEQIKRSSQGSTKSIHHLLLVPRKTLIATKILEDSGVLGDVVVHEFPLHFIPLDEDLLSLEYEGAFKDLYLHGDITCLDYVARALMYLQRVLGSFPRILGKGDYGKVLADLLLRMRKEGSVSSSSHNLDGPRMASGFLPSNSPLYPTNIDSAIIIDRAADLITPMLTQMTYTGLVDEYIGIRTGHIELDSSLFAKSKATDEVLSPDSSSAAASSSSPSPSSSRTRQVPLSSQDRIYRSLRDLNYAAVGSRLRQAAMTIQQVEDSRHSATTTTALRNFVGRLAELTSEKASLGQHTTISEIINSKVLTEDFDKLVDTQQDLLAGIDVNRSNRYVEMCIDKQAPLTQVLRILCLQCLVAGGLPTKYYDTVCQDIVQTYGYQHGLTLHKLAVVRLLYPQITGRNPFPQVRKHLKLIVDEFGEDMAQPLDMAFTYSGYAPISIRLIEVVTRPVKVEGSPNLSSRVTRGIAGWRGYDDVVRILGGATIDENQVNDQRVSHWGRKKAKVTVLIFLGGVTYSEISAIRWLASQEAGRREFLIITTQVINGDGLIKDFLA